MSVRIKLASGIYLTPLNSYELFKMDSNFVTKCVMCRDELTKNTKSVEHIYPKWLQERYNLWDKTMTLPNGSKTSYRQLTVPCCKECNGGVMAEWEKLIQQASEQGYDCFVELSEEVIAWWVMKLYYAKLIKELSFRENIKDPASGMMITDEKIVKYNVIFYYMNELIKGAKFNDPKPYELYIYRTMSNNDFDYIDDTLRHVVYIQISDILIVCALDSFGVFKVQYQRETERLRELEVVHPLQAIELFSKIVYFKSHYSFDTEHTSILDSKGLTIDSKIGNLQQLREFNLIELHNLMENLFKLRGCSFEIPPFQEGKMSSLIPSK